MSHQEEHQKGGRRKGLLVLVSIVALGVWGGVVFQLTIGLRGSDASTAYVAPSGSAGADEEGAAIPSYRNAPHDIFRPPASLRAPSSASEEEETKLSEPKRPETPPAITLELAGIVDGMALLATEEGRVRLVREGETLRDHRLVEAGGDFVLLEVDAREDTLRLHPRRRELTIR